MNWEAIGALGETIGAIAVISTLAYIALQTHRARVATEASSSMATVDLYSRWRSSLLQNSDLPVVLAKANRAEPLTDEEAIQLQYLADDLFSIATITYANNMNSGSLHDRLGDINFLAGTLRANPGLVEEWVRFRTALVFASDEFVSAINNELDLKEEDDAA